jgi:hypothetical protein
MQKRADSLKSSTTGLRFDKLSQDISAGARAMNTQEMRYRATQQLNTAEALQKELESVWNTLGTADDLISQIVDKVQEAGGAQGQTGFSVLRQEVSALKDELLRVVNTQYGGKFVFGGTNNAAAPFTVDEANGGRLLFNGAPVERIYKSDADGKYYSYQDGFTEPQPGDALVPESDPVFLDVGLGLKVNGGVDARTAFQANIIGLEILGCNGFVSDTANTEIDKLPAIFLI